MANRGGQTGRRNRHYGDSVGNTAVRNLQFIDISNMEEEPEYRASRKASGARRRVGEEDMPYRRKVEEYPSDRRIKRENQGRRRASAAAIARRRRRKRQRLLAGAFLVAGVIVLGGLL